MSTLLPATTVVISTHFHLKDIVRPGFGEPPEWAPAAYALMNYIPDGATVATEDSLVNSDRTDLIDQLLAGGAEPTRQGPFILLRR